MKPHFCFTFLLITILSFSVVWSSNAATMVSQPNPNQFIFKKSSNGNGAITANVASGCGGFTVSFSIQAGPYSSSDYSNTGTTSASFTISVRDLKNGSYVLNVFDGKNTYEAPLIIMH